MLLWRCLYGASETVFKKCHINYPRRDLFLLPQRCQPRFLGWKDTQGTPAIQMHIGQSLPAEIHGMGSGMENKEQQWPCAAADTRARAGTPQTAPNPACLPLPVCPAQKLPLRRNLPNIILSINLLSAPNVNTVAKENSFLCECLSGAARERQTSLSCCFKDQMWDLSAETPENPVPCLGKICSLLI